MVWARVPATLRCLRCPIRSYQQPHRVTALLMTMGVTTHNTALPQRPFGHAFVFHSTGARVKWSFVLRRRLLRSRRRRQCFPLAVRGAKPSMSRGQLKLMAFVIGFSLFVLTAGSLGDAAFRSDTRQFLLVCPFTLAGLVMCLCGLFWPIKPSHQ